MKRKRRRQKAESRGQQSINAYCLLPCAFCFLSFTPHPSSLIPSFRGGKAEGRPNRHNRRHFPLEESSNYINTLMARALPTVTLANCAPEVVAWKNFSSSQQMYFALMILTALVAAALVLLMERRGDPRLLEREYKSQADASKKSPAK
jgi:hypothetical protein